MLETISGHRALEERRCALYETVANSRLQTPIKVTTRPAREDDIPKIIDAARVVPELTFEHWENSTLLNNLIHNSPSGIRVAMHEDLLVGFVVGGTFGVRATVSHVWVAEAFRGGGVGKSLCEEMLNSFAELGIRRVRVMVIGGNDGAKSFWERRGFVCPENESFLELDL